MKSLWPDPWFAMVCSVQDLHARKRLGETMLRRSNDRLYHSASGGVG